MQTRDQAYVPSCRKHTPGEKGIISAVANQIKSEAFILRRFRHGDTSLVLHVFTREAGRVPFIAKGARSGGRKPPVPLVQAVLLEMIWRPSNRSELQLLREWSLLDGFGAIHRDFEKLAWAQAGLEVLARTLTGEQAHEELFDETMEYFRSVGETRDRYAILLLKLRLIALRELGYEIDLTVEEKGPSNGRFLPDQGRWCGGDNEGVGIPVQLGSWKLLAALARTPWDQLKTLRPGRQAFEQMELLLDAAYRHAFDRWLPLESLKLLEPMNAGVGPGEKEADR